MTKAATKTRAKRGSGDPHMLCQYTVWGPLEGLKPGDRVAYTAAFCRALGMIGGQRRGTFVGQHAEVKEWAVVKWDDEEEAQPIRYECLAVPGANRRFAQANG